MADEYIKFRCKNCMKRVGVSSRHADGYVRCPLCGGPTPVPAKSEPKRRRFRRPKKPTGQADYIKYYCENCDKRIGVPAEHGGKVILCPLCGKATHVPQETQAHRYGTPTEKEHVKAAGGDEFIRVLETSEPGQETPPPLEAQAETAAPGEPIVPSPADVVPQDAPAAPAEPTAAETPQGEGIASAPPEAPQVAAQPPPPPQPREDHPREFVKSSFSLDKLKKVSEDLPKAPEVVVVVEPAARGFTFLTSVIVVVAFTLLLVVVMKRRVISYYLFAHPRGPVYANTNQDVAARMRGIQQALIKYHEARRVAPESLDALQQNKFIVSDEGLKDAKGHWLYTYEKLTRREFYDYENPRILLCETPEAAKAGVRHILFSNGNVVGIPASKFDDYVEKLRKAMAGRSAPTPDAPPSSPGANR